MRRAAEGGHQSPGYGRPACVALTVQKIQVRCTIFQPSRLSALTCDMTADVGILLLCPNSSALHPILLTFVPGACTESQESHRSLPTLFALSELCTMHRAAQRQQVLLGHLAAVSLTVQRPERRCIPPGSDSDYRIPAFAHPDCPPNDCRRSSVTAGRRRAGAADGRAPHVGGRLCRLRAPRRLRRRRGDRVRLPHRALQGQAWRLQGHARG